MTRYASANLHQPCSAEGAAVEYQRLTIAAGYAHYCDYIRGDKVPVHNVKRYKYAQQRHDFEYVIDFVISVI